MGAPVDRLIELGIMGLQIWMNASAAAGLSEEEKAELYARTKAEYEARDPAALKTVT